MICRPDLENRESVLDLSTSTRDVAHPKAIRFLLSLRSVRRNVVSIDEYRAARNRSEKREETRRFPRCSRIGRSREPRNRKRPKHRGTSIVEKAMLSLSLSGMTACLPSQQSVNRAASARTESNRDERRRDETRRDEASQGVHTSMGRIISAGRRKINKRNITSAAGSTELGSGHGIGWGKRDGNGSRKRC